MSRVDEALRRAAEAAARNGDAEPPSGTPAVGVDPEEFAKESFPIEMPERRRPRSVVTDMAESARGGREDSESAGMGVGPHANQEKTAGTDREGRAPRAPIDESGRGSREDSESAAAAGMGVRPHENQEKTAGTEREGRAPLAPIDELTARVRREAGESAPAAGVVVRPHAIQERTAGAERERRVPFPPIEVAGAGSVGTATPPEPTASSSIFECLDRRLSAKVVVDQTMLPASREQYRRLAATLHHNQLATGLKVVMIASAVVGEGKTLTAANLALTLSESYQRNVLLMDADLRRPSLNTVFGMNGSPGLAEGLSAVEEPKLTLHQVSEHLSILPAGKPNSDPMAGLTSARMRRLIDEARDAFDWIIIDTPPVALITDANLLAAMVDGAVLVVHAGSTPYDLVKRAVEALGTGRLLGVVLNRAVSQAKAYGYGYDYYNHYHASVAESPRK